MSARRIPIVFGSDLPACERCGVPLASPGLCQACAEFEAGTVCVEIPDNQLLTACDFTEKPTTKGLK